mgnify:CR=1 FL=1
MNSASLGGGEPGLLLLFTEPVGVVGVVGVLGDAASSLGSRSSRVSVESPVAESSPSSYMELARPGSKSAKNNIIWLTTKISKTNKQINKQTKIFLYSSPFLRREDVSQHYGMTTPQVSSTILLN